MKFGKLILDVQALSLEAWRPGFMDYKALKKVLKAARPKPADVAPSQLASQLGECLHHEAGGVMGCFECATCRLPRERRSPAPPAAPDQAEIRTGKPCSLPHAATCPEEVQFFTMLKAELQKVSDFYLVCENEMLARYKELVSSLTMYKVRRRRGVSACFCQTDPPANHALHAGRAQGCQQQRWHPPPAVCRAVLHGLAAARELRGH